MASPGELMLSVSQATGVPLPTIVDMDRRLTRAGLRSKGGRGLNAARMTALDAARLLTAVLASHQANASVEAVTRYAGTRIDKARSTDRVFADIGLADLAALPARHGFVDVLTALIVSAMSGDLRRLIANVKKPWSPDIKVYAFTRATRGRIRLGSLPGGLTASVEYIPAPTGSACSRKAADTILGDLEQSRRITGRTILAIADLLREEPTDD